MNLPNREHHETTDDGKTPLNPDEAGGLIPSWIVTRGDLNIAEEENVAAGLAWGRRVLARHDVLSQDFLRTLHERMFSKVWTWAGRYRVSEKNIGVAPDTIPTELKILFDDVKAWHEYNSYPMDERAMRLHHRLTWVHPFANGNGRCARVFADLYLAKNGAKEFTWGEGLWRDQYIAAIRAADARDYGPLRAFLRRDGKVRPT